MAWDADITNDKINRKNKNKKRKNRIPETNPLNTNCDNVSSNLFEI